MRTMAILIIFNLSISWAQTTVNCPIPPTAISPVVSVNIKYDKKKGVYQYQYKVENKSDAQVAIAAFRLKTNATMISGNAPKFWKYGGYSDHNKNINWSNPGIVDNKDILPGKYLAGFELTSAVQPGLVRLSVIGMPGDLPTVASDTIGEAEDESEFYTCPGFYTGLDSEVTLATLGPRPSNQIDVKLRLKKMKDKKWRGRYDGEAELDITPLETGKIQVILFDDKDIDTSKIDLTSLEFGHGKAKPVKTYFMNEFKDDTDDVEIKEHLKIHNRNHLVMEFELEDVDIRCDIDRALFLTGKIADQNLMGAVKIKHTLCDEKTFNKPRKQKKPNSKNKGRH